MPGASSGRIVKTRKVKGGTQHQKNHRWESFTTKISKLNSLDPIRRVRRHDSGPEDVSTKHSYLKAGLDKWQELNMSEDFSAFSHEILPLCDSLPQLLHFEGKIAEVLFEYLGRKERESLEPLLELLTDFAHDLGARFERYYAQALELVASIATVPNDVAVVEWCFTCLAFMFKYLSKLLVPDLRPTYDLMAPLLGKHRQQPHIARFTAEAMSFLVKKAGTPGHLDTALPLIIHHSKQDLESLSNGREARLYYHGIMTLFAEAMKGNGMNVHTSGIPILRALFSSLEEKDLLIDRETSWPNVICGVLTSIVHHTSLATFQDIQDIVLEIANDAASTLRRSKNETSFQKALVASRMMGTVVGVRTGSRISNWPSLLKAVCNLAGAISETSQAVGMLEHDMHIWHSLVLTVSIALQYSSMDALIPFISPMMDLLTKEPLAKWFLSFCSCLSAGDHARFQSIALPYFQRFVIAHWSDADNGDVLCLLLPRMVSMGALPRCDGKDGFNLPQSWQDQIVSKFEGLEVKPFPEQASSSYDHDPKKWEDRCLPKYNALLDILECTRVHPSTNARIAEILLRKLKLALRPNFSIAPEEAHFIVGRGFKAICRMLSGAGEDDNTLQPLLRAKAPTYARLPSFLEALLTYESNLKSIPKSKDTQSDSPGTEAGDPLVSSLIANLSTASHELRLLSLRLLIHTHNLQFGHESEALSVMLMVEQTPLNIQTSRSASMHLRKLANIFFHQAENSWVKEAIPSFCYGMFTVKSAQIWEDASAALKDISASKDGEKSVAGLAFSWLDMPSQSRDGNIRNPETLRNNGLTDFECSNLMKLKEAAEESMITGLEARKVMLRRFADAQQLVDLRPPSARSQALKVLTAAPSIAERRSQILVPMFLKWTDRSDIEEQDDDSQREPSDWTRKDQKAQLDLFGLFVNPKSLYQSDRVYETALGLLTNGDIDFQKSALKVIFTWKSKSIRPYEENLLNLLDEARFKEEIAILMQGDTLVQPEHRHELMPVLLRVLYGRAISRKGAASGRQGLEARRLTVLRNLGARDIEGFLDIALGDLKDLVLVKQFQAGEPAKKEIISVRKQVGFTTMMEVVLRELATKIAPFTTKLLDAVLYCLIYASRQLQYDTTNEGQDNQLSQNSMLRVIRQIALKCLILLFTNSENFDWSPYIGVINQEVIIPRLDNLPIETAQGVSGLLQLFATWSASANTVLLLDCNKDIIPKVSECLVPPKSKSEVRLFALNIIKNIVKLTSDDNEKAVQIREGLLSPNTDRILKVIGAYLRDNQDMSKDLLESCVETVSDLASVVNTSSQAYNLVDVATFLLDQPSRRVSPKTKGSLLKVLEHFVPLYDLQNNESLKDKVFKTITSLFGFFKDKASREVLSRVLMVYADSDPMLEQAARLCVDLNSFIEGRLDEADYDRRLRAFNAISAQAYSFNSRQWAPLLYNMLYYIKHDEEFAILSSNSSDGICHFIDAAQKSTQDDENTAFERMLSTILLPAIYAGVREPSEVIRREYVKVMARLVRAFPTWIEVSDMHGLLAGDDELESSFFNNILTAGKGRQSSALGLISVAAERGELSAKNVSHFFIPLIEHFILDRADGNDAHNLAAEATTAIGVLAGSLEWPQYRAMLRRFIGYVEGKTELEKQMIKLLGKVIDALAMVAQDSGDDTGTTSTLKSTMPKPLKFAEDLTSNILPPLTAYLHDKDESTVSLRVPVAVIIVRLLKLLPEDQLHEKLAPVLTDICHILRSKAQESRDMTRDTLTKICQLLGPSCFGFVLKELRGALARGYQLHVLSYTMHSMLVATTPDYSPGDLDYCLPTIVAIIMDDIFGATGQEKDAEEYISKMKEVKSSKSHDSMELIARTATLRRLTDLVRPIQVLLKEKLNLRMVRKIDELLNRISTGLLKNSAVQSKDSLIFCYEILLDGGNSPNTEKLQKDDYRLKKYLIQKGAKKSGERGSTTVYSYKLVRFGLDVLRAVLKKHDNLRSFNNLAGFIPILGDIVVQGQEELKIAAFKLLTSIVKVPLGANEGSNLYKVAMAEANRAISSSSTTTSDISQAALKLLAVILRDRRDVTVKDSAVDELLGRLRQDMTEPEHRHVTFNFLRCVMDSHVETAMVYDTLDYVGTVMVTNDDKDTRDLARGAYFQFIREYPQKKSRWTKQLAFIVSNLKYAREGGRLSILEVIHLLLSRSSPEFVQEVSATSFVPLIFVLANDESEKCRMAAGEVIKDIFNKADSERMKPLLALLRSWINQTENPAVLRLAFQTYSLYYESQPTDSGDVVMLLEAISGTVRTVDESSSDWEQIFAALQLFSVLATTFPDMIFSTHATLIWFAIRNCLSYPHAWIKESAARLTGTLLADFARNNATKEIESLPLEGSGGLRLNGEETNDYVRRFSRMFMIPGLTVDLGTEIVKNLGFLGLIASACALKIRRKDLDDSEDEDDAELSESKSTLQYLFARLSFILRRESSPPRAPTLIPKTAALGLLTNLIAKLSPNNLVPCLPTILLPLHNLTDQSIPVPYSTDDLFRASYESLRTDSESLMESIKRKVGTKDYSEAILEVRKEVRERREKRSGKRKIEAVSMPERFGAHKRKKGERKKERRKERGQEHAKRRNEY